ncbi:LacI family transcriptional regulator [Flavobacteriaceae bacterium F89]|uniref:LacI family transcriptional regulator n=1 Tax=Cerina litoralis TaxID=2874477 RepID=A0AAE3EZ60_9FLAO|nr:LacI family DNA-binding transcriptional regulator [Cerina litoralis]MCG2462371.1 LacI family transcriptional regulator [Cerina litoralis]
MKKKALLKDIAKKVGVSIATVSYVLSKGKESKVSVEMSEKIKKVAKELNYQPNQIAKSLKSGRTFTIGLVVADISNPFFAHIARIIEDEAAKLGYTLVFSSSDERAEKSWGLIKFLINRQVDGFIIVPTKGSEDQIKHLKEQNIPFVLIDRYFQEIPSNYVVIDNFGAAYKAVERLIVTGNKKIGIIAYGNSLVHMKGRIKGAMAAMENHNLKVNESWLKEINFSSIGEDVVNGINGLLLVEEPVTAIFFASNSLAIHGMKQIDKLGLKVPNDVAIVSFDQGEAFDFYYSPITYIQQPLTELGKEAVKILVDEISDPEIGYKQMSLEAKLIVRESCGKASLR